MKDGYSFFRPKRTARESPEAARSREEDSAAQRIGEEIKRLRSARSITQAQLAAAIGRSVQSLETIEAGRRFPNGRTLYRIAKALGADLVIPCEVEES